jgi:hypothetical protein
MKHPERKGAGRVRRRLVPAAAALLVLGGVPLGALATASPANAAVGCSRDGSGYLDGDASAVSYTFDCSSSGLHVWGTIWDDTCDGRTAYVSAKVTNHLYGDIYSFGWSRDAKANNGCGSSASFNFTGDGSTDGRLEVCTWASSLTSSSRTCNTWSLW